MVVLMVGCSGCSVTQHNGGSISPHRLPQAGYADYLKARMYVADGDIERAVECLSAARRLDPASVYLRSAQASLYLEQGELEKAYKLLEEAQQLEPDNVDVQLLRADLLYSRNDNDDRMQAMMMFHNILEQHPDLDELYLHLSQLHLLEHDYPQALAVIQRFLKRKPDDLNGLLQQGKIYILLDEDKQAQGVYRKIISLYPRGRRAYVYLGNLLEQDKQLDSALLLYKQAAHETDDPVYFDHLSATLLTKHQRYAAALKILNDLLDLDPLDYSALSKIGLVHLQQQQWPLAEQTLLRAVALKPTAQDYYWLGYALEQQEKWSAAAAAYRLVVEPRYLLDEATERLAFVYAQSGDFGRAAQTIEQLLQRGKSDQKKLFDAKSSLRPAVYLQLALYYEYMQKSDKVVATLKRGLENYPDSAELYYAAGVYYAQQGNVTLMEQNMRHTIALQDDHAGALNYLAYTYADDNNNLDEALDMAQRAVDINANGAYIDTLGWVYYRRGQFAQARTYLEKALKIMPQDLLIQEHVADVYVALGLSKQAQKIYTELLEKKPDNKKLQQKLKDIRH